ncbi:MAG: hypothetical protein ACLVK5_00480 [Peptoniphilus senegalensis]
MKEKKTIPTYEEFKNEVKKYLRGYTHFKNLTDEALVSLDSFEEFVKLDYESFINDLSEENDFDRELKNSAELSAYNVFLMN